MRSLSELVRLRRKQRAHSGHVQYLDQGVLRWIGLTPGDLESPSPNSVEAPSPNGQAAEPDGQDEVLDIPRLQRRRTQRLRLLPLVYALSACACVAPGLPLRWRFLVALAVFFGGHRLISGPLKSRRALTDWELHHRQTTMVPRLKQLVTDKDLKVQEVPVANFRLHPVVLVKWLPVGAAGLGILLKLAPHIHNPLVLVSLWLMWAGMLAARVWDWRCTAWCITDRKLGYFPGINTGARWDDWLPPAKSELVYVSRWSRFLARCGAVYVPFGRVKLRTIGRGSNRFTALILNVSRPIVDSDGFDELVKAMRLLQDESRET